MLDERLLPRASEGVSEWIACNYAQHDDAFEPCLPTARTKILLEEVERKHKLELSKGGVLCTDATIPSSILSHSPVYIADDPMLDTVIVGLQTTKLFERTMKLKGGVKMVEKALQEQGELMDPLSKKIFNENVRTHNEYVFSLYTKEMRAVRSSHAFTGLPDSYGRGRLICDYRRVALL